MAAAEAAALGDCPVGTVRSCVARVRTTLTALVAEAEEANTAAPTTRLD
ncbi:hypothetical protein H114_29740 [Streptomyces gancidicus BKS 13-15]|uniref:Uncharacterized protein n=1 Tax=Streptomyces gancidicus BKS 13-15 TaxID=1284664 RepID=M3CGA7_STREZ|nr:hypothetical protein H114_29740 [Streptomyces gancidicus BKS 13-15]